MTAGWPYSCHRYGHYRIHSHHCPVCVREVARLLYFIETSADDSELSRRAARAALQILGYAPGEAPSFSEEKMFGSAGNLSIAETLGRVP